MTAAPSLPMNARTPEDILAAVPILLGFVPERSVVMLTFGAEHVFNARVDLPIDAGDIQTCADLLLRPALRHRVAAVLFVLYAESAAQAAWCAEVLVRTFWAEDIEVLTVLRSDGHRWFCVPPDRSAREGPGTPYDVSSHVFTARAVASGRVTRSSRDELAATVAADRSAVRAVRKARAGAAADTLHNHEDEARWLLSKVDALAAEQARADPQTSARLLLALCEPAVRDVVLGALDRRRAESMVPVLSALVRGAPSELVAPSASVLAFVAWLAGDGALAWCALDRAAEGSPRCTLADRVAEALEMALPPALWEQR